MANFDTRETFLDFCSKFNINLSKETYTLLGFMKNDQKFFVDLLSDQTRKSVNDTFDRIDKAGGKEQRSFVKSLMLDVNLS